MNILIVDEKRIISDEAEELLYETATAILNYEDIDMKPLEIGVNLVEDAQIKALNRDFRGIDKVTDVLSFPQYEDVSELRNAKGNIIPVGDVVICYDKVITQAEEFGHTVERELIYLFVHSVLHLLGYDHETDDDKKKMREREKAIMQELNILR